MKNKFFILTLSLIALFSFDISAMKRAGDPNLAPKAKRGPLVRKNLDKIRTHSAPDRTFHGGVENGISLDNSLEGADSSSSSLLDMDIRGLGKDLEIISEGGWDDEKPLTATDAVNLFRAPGYTIEADTATIDASILDAESICLNGISIEALIDFVNYFENNQDRPFHKVQTLYFFGDGSFDFKNGAHANLVYIQTLKRLLALMPNLEALHISFAPIAGGLDILFDGLELPHLRALKLNHITDGCYPSLLSNDTGDVLLNIRPQDMSDQETQRLLSQGLGDLMLAHIGVLPCFEKLVLFEAKDNGITNSGIYNLVNAPFSPIVLSLPQNKITLKGLQAIGMSEDFHRNLTVLDLSANPAKMSDDLLSHLSLAFPDLEMYMDNRASKQQKLLKPGKKKNADSDESICVDPSNISAEEHTQRIRAFLEERAQAPKEEGEEAAERSEINLLLTAPNGDITDLLEEPKAIPMDCDLDALRTEEKLPEDF